MGKFIFGLIIGVILFPVVVYFYFQTGMAPVATTAPPMPFEKMFARMALHARMDKEVPKTVPIQADETNFAAGAQVYKEHCAVCHGLPSGQETAIAKGMFPDPPKLLQGKGVTDDPPGESYWKIAGVADFNGDGSTDLLLENTATGDHSIWLLKDGVYSGNYLYLGRVPTAWRLISAKSA